MTTTEVTPSSFWIELISLPMVAEVDRVEAGGGLVEQHHLGVEGERAGQRHALAHAAGEVRGHLAPRRPAGCTMASFWRTVSAISASARSVCSRSGKATLSKTFIESNSAPLWKSMAMRRRSGNSSRSSSARELGAVEDDAAGVGLLEAVELAQGHALAGARAAEDHQALAAQDVEVEAVEHGAARRSSWSGRGLEERFRHGDRRPVTSG